MLRRNRKQSHTLMTLPSAADAAVAVAADASTHLGFFCSDCWKKSHWEERKSRNLRG
ncbi:hypothetical protein LINPERHAP2_LOCUS17308 [Linum perenne]